MSVYVEARPTGLAAQFVDNYWSCANYSVLHRRERMLPGNSFQLVIDLAHDRMPQWIGDICQQTGPALVVGLTTRYTIMDTTSLRRLVGVVFKPGCARALFPQPLDDFSNAEIDLDLLWGSFSCELRERLQAAPDTAGLWKVLDLLLAERLHHTYTPHPALLGALRELNRQPETTRIAALADSAGISVRRLTQLFREYVGLTPKSYCRVARLQKALRHPGVHQRHGDWARVAADCGYYDQSHFAHEFRDFSGFTLSDFSTRARPWTNHIVLD